MPRPIDADSQLAYFRAAVDLLGGNRAAARQIGVSDRHVRYVLAGDREPHDGLLRDTAAALLAHSTKCLALERRLTPAFSANLTERQRTRMGKPDARRFDAKETAR